MPSLQILILLAVAFGAILYYWWRDIQAGRMLRRLVGRVKETRPEAWAALPRLPRTIFPQAGLAELHRTGAVDDPDFEPAYRDLLAARPSVWILILGVAAIGLILVGVRMLGWQW